MEQNEFAKMTKVVTTMVERYRLVRKECGINDKGWHSRTIELKALPFLKGYFTLAIVGKVSSGKSTFVNALLGCKDLLPTGHDQTTSGITYIEYCDTPEVTIMYGDSHTTTFSGEDIARKVKPYVSIPEEYHDLPVNNIDSMILGGFDFNKIWEVRDQLEAETNCNPIDKVLLKKYVSNRSKKNIATEVHIKYPFDENLKGWRIIDTPGIGAIGGIEETTKQLLNLQKKDGSREVDANIFLQDGSQTLDQIDSKRFVKEQLNNFTEEDKHKLFFVLTHCSDLDFINHKENKLDFINKSYGDKIKCLTYADSLLYTFLNDPALVDADLKYYDDFIQFPGWADDEWDVVMQVLDNAKRFLKKSGDTVNHETMLRMLEDWSHFNELKKQINTFAKTEKASALKELVGLIATDYLGFIKQLEEVKNLVAGGLSAINKAIEDVQAKREEYNRISRLADEQIKGDDIVKKFGFIDDRLKEFSKLTSTLEVRTAVTNLFDDVQKKEKEMINDIKKTFAVFFNEIDSNDLIFESIDLDEIENQATPDKEKDKYIISPARTETHLSGPDERIPAKYNKDLIEEDKLRNFIALAKKRIHQSRDKFQIQVRQKAQKMSDLIYEELNSKIKDAAERYESCKIDLGNTEERKRRNDFAIEKAKEASLELVKISEYYDKQI